MQPLRYYQRDRADEACELLKEHHSCLIVMATGLGKTRVATELIERFKPGRTLFIVGQRDLVFQGAKHIERVTGIDCDIEMAERVAATSFWNRHGVVVSTFQTLISGQTERKRLHRLKPADFSLVIVDEAHESIAISRQETIRYFLDGNPELKLVGLTATPCRTDEQALGKIFESGTKPYELADAIKDGWLVNVEQRIVSVHGLDFSHIITTAGDLNGAQLAQVMEQESVVMEIVQPTLEAMYGLPVQALSKLPIEQWREALVASGNKPIRTIVFTVRVHHAEMLCDIFNRVLDGAAGWVSGNTAKEQRRKIMESFADGRLSLLCNVNVCGQGYDNPAVGLIVMARPTKSLLRYQQMLGRGTRTLEGILDAHAEGVNGSKERLAAIGASEKIRLIVLDPVGNSGRHVIVNSVDVLGGNYDEEVIARAKKRAETEGKAVATELLEEEAAALQKELEERRVREAARKAKLVGKVIYTVKVSNPFDVLGLQPVRDRGWDVGKQISPGMVKVLNQMKVDYSNLPYGQALQLVREQIRRWKNHLATTKQVQCLRKYYSDLDWKNLPFKEASRLIDGLAKNNWTKP